MGDRAALLRELKVLLGAGACLDDAAARRVYARDASRCVRGEPLCVCLPGDAEAAAAVVRLCAAYGVPLTARGAGTGLAGGAVPDEGGVVLSLARLCDVVDEPAGALAGAGLTNAALDRRFARRGLSYAPDPSSQEASTLGGNVAANAGGPHCLKVGTTVQHVRGLEWIDAGGVRRGSGDTTTYGVDLTALLVGGEGTLGVVTGVRVRAVPADAARSTLLVYFPTLETAVRSVVGLLGAGLLPAALECVDGVMLAVVEEAFAFGFRTDAGAALIVEFAGAAAAVVDDAARAASRFADDGALEVVAADDETERLALWRCRKRAFGAVGRLAPAYVSLDVAVPLERLPAMVDTVRAIGAAHGVRIATALHAGDGNLHPGIMYNDRDPASTARARAAADAVVAAALEHGGTVSGEHGVGVEKLSHAAAQLEPVALDLMHDVRALFDPQGLLNPGKALPASSTAVAPHRPASPRLIVEGLRVTAPSDTDCFELQAELLARGFWLSCGLPRPGIDLGRLARFDPVQPMLLRSGPLRDLLLEVWARTGDGRAFHAGRPTAKNVVGYDLPRLVCGNGGLFATVEALSLQIRPAPRRCIAWRLPDAAVALPGVQVTHDAAGPVGLWWGHPLDPLPERQDAVAPRLWEGSPYARLDRLRDLCLALPAAPDRLPPPPAADVPLDLLRGLKRLFDPDGVLPTPDWLREEA